MRMYQSIVTICLLAGVTGCAHAPKPEVSKAEEAPSAPQPPREEKKVVVTPPPTVDRVAEFDAAIKGTVIYFDFDSDRLPVEGMSSLQHVADVLRRHGAVTLKIVGNCDERGTEEYNMQLGQRRAEAARRYLADLGVSPAQLDTISYGSLRPVNPAHSEEAWRQNRRDELQAAR